MQIIELHASVTDSNDRDAERVRASLKAKGQFMVNVMSSPGSGKTTILSTTIKALINDYKIGVMEADIESDVDAITIQKLGAEAIQVHTDGMCHMDAGMSEEALQHMQEDNDILFLENVGNLICPAEYDTGASKNVMILSITEGHDKPLKYPLMFEKSDVLLISKIDAKDYFDFDFSKCEQYVKRLNPNIQIFPVSAKTGEGMNVWYRWLKESLEDWRK